MGEVIKLPAAVRRGYYPGFPDYKPGDGPPPGSENYYPRIEGDRIVTGPTPKPPAKVAALPVPPKPIDPGDALLAMAAHGYEWMAWCPHCFGMLRILDDGSQRCWTCGQSPYAAKRRRPNLVLIGVIALSVIVCLALIAVAAFRR